MPPCSPVAPCSPVSLPPSGLPPRRGPRSVRPRPVRTRPRPGQRLCAPGLHSTPRPCSSVSSIAWASRSRPPSRFGVGLGRVPVRERHHDPPGRRHPRRPAFGLCGPRTLRRRRTRRLHRRLRVHRFQHGAGLNLLGGALFDPTGIGRPFASPVCGGRSGPPNSLQRRDPVVLGRPFVPASPARWRCGPSASSFRDRATLSATSATPSSSDRHTLVPPQPAT